MPYNQPFQTFIKILLRAWGHWQFLIPSFVLLSCGEKTNLFHENQLVIAFHDSPENLMQGLDDAGFRGHWESIEMIGPTPASNSSGLGFAVVHFKVGSNPSEAAKSWERLRIIEFSEPNHLSKIKSYPYSQFALQYEDINRRKARPWFQAINLIEGFELLAADSTNERPIIAVMDSGIDISHPALAEKIWQNPGVATSCKNDLSGCNTTAASSRSLGNGLVNPIGTTGHGEECRGLTPEIYGQCIHGTHAAGMIAAAPGFSYGGICPTCQILPIKIMDLKDGQSPGILDSSIIAGLVYIRELRAKGVPIRVVNASFGKFQRSQAVSHLIAELTGDKSGVLFVAAAGNENTSEPQYPAAMHEVIGVSNIDPQTGERQPRSNFGSWVDLAAPGTNRRSCDGDPGILSITPGNNAACAEGTSVSAPIVSGVAGLILTQRPDISVQELRRNLISSANPDIYEVKGNEVFKRRIDNQTYPLLGAGLIDVKASLLHKPQGLKVGKDHRRIKSGCGIISQQTTGSSTLFLFIIPLLIPLWGLRYEN